MIKLSYLHLAILVVVLLSSCKDDPLDLSEITVSARNIFVNDTITLSFESEGHSNIQVTSDNESMQIIKNSESEYAVTSSTEASGTITVSAENKDQSKSVTTVTYFYDHGVKNFEIVEGIKKDVDKKSKVIELLGDPDAIRTSENDRKEYLYYFSEGLKLNIEKSTKIVRAFYLYSDNWSTTINDVKYYFSTYPYDLGYSWKLLDSNSTIDDVVSIQGIPDVKETNPTNPHSHRYKFTKISTWFYFHSDSLDNYINKKITRVDMY